MAGPDPTAIVKSYVTKDVDAKTRKEVQYNYITYANGDRAVYRWDTGAATWIFYEMDDPDVNQQRLFLYEQQQYDKAEERADKNAAAIANDWSTTTRNGQVFGVNPSTGESKPIEGLPVDQTSQRPSYVPAGQVDRTQQWIVYFDPVTGTNKEILNPNYNAEYAALEADKIRAAIAASQASAAASNRPPQGATSSPTDYMREGREADKWAWEKGTQFPWQQETWQKNYDLTKGKNESDADYNRRRIEMETAQNEALRKQWLAQNEQSRQDLVSRTADWMTGRTTEASKWAMTPGQEYFMGFEPGGPWEDVAKRSGFKYDPNIFRPRPVAFDPQAQLNAADAWTQEQARRRGGA